MMDWRNEVVTSVLFEWFYKRSLIFFLYAFPKQEHNANVLDILLIVAYWTNAVHVNSAEISPNLVISGDVTAAFWTS